MIVSACLLGRACRYDGASKPKPDALTRFGEGVEWAPVGQLITDRRGEIVALTDELLAVAEEAGLP